MTTHCRWACLEAAPLAVLLETERAFYTFYLAVWVSTVTS